jgi:hypothetical protein
MEAIKKPAGIGLGRKRENHPNAGGGDRWAILGQRHDVTPKEEERSVLIC